jgi:hypothetical protein
MPRLFSLVFLAVVWVAPSRSADAQSLNYSVQCAFGSFQACASVHIWQNVDATTGQPYLFVKVANVQGLPRFKHLPQAGLGSWSLDDMRHDLPASTNPEELVDRIENFSTLGLLSGNSLRCQRGASCTPLDPSVRTFIGEGAQGRFVDGSLTIFDPLVSSPELMWGCSGIHALSAYGDEGKATCGGHATWRVSLGSGAGIYFTKETDLNLYFETYDPTGGLQTVSCTTGVDCVTVTPEPGTIILLGSGLAGLGAAYRRHRRKSSDEFVSSG